MTIKNTSGIKPVGNTVLVKPIEKEEVTSGGIVIPNDVRDRETVGAEYGVVIEIAPEAWHGSRDCGYKNWCKVGDTVLYARYAGKAIPKDTSADGCRYTLMNDADIMGVKHA